MSQRKYFSATLSIIALTTALFAGFFIHEYRNLQSYMSYIAENGKSALFHEEFINQNIAFRLSRLFSSAADSDRPAKDICQYVESIGEISGLNLVAHTTPYLHGTLQTRNPSCASWGMDVPALNEIQATSTTASSNYSFSNYTGYHFNNIRYYIDLFNNYIYINQLVDTRHYTFNNWLVSNDGHIDVDSTAHTINIDADALEDLHHGESIVSHVYRDGYSHNNIISMLTPVFQKNRIKGILVTDISIRDLATSFYTPLRPFMWRFLSLYVTDNATGDRIVFHQPTLKTVALLNHQESMTRYYTLHIKLDGIYVVVSNLWLIVIYLLSTWLLCRYAKKQLARRLSLSHDNITDAMTGLYNRKILTPQFEQKIKSLLGKKIAVTVIAIDSDGLKRINDTLGHHMGDRAIQILGTALAQSIRKSDYAIRQGGDEFCLILIDNTLAKSRDVIRRIQESLALMAGEIRVEFSYGSYQLTNDDTLESALLKADALLYQHKRNKASTRTSEHNADNQK